MPLLKKIKLIATFYSNISYVTLIITIACIWIFLKIGIASFAALFWFKLSSLGLIYLYVNHYKSREIYYYQNLGASKFLLWTSTLVFDFTLFIVSLIISHYIR